MTSQIVEEQIKEFDKIFTDTTQEKIDSISFSFVKEAVARERKVRLEWLKSFAQTLINATLDDVKEKVIGEDERAFDNIKGITITDNSRMFRNGLRAQQRSQLEGMKV